MPPQTTAQFARIPRAAFNGNYTLPQLPWYKELTGYQWFVFIVCCLRGTWTA